jgi:hypothetical protein
MDSIQRDLFHKQLKSVDGAVRYAFNQCPDLVSVKKNNELIRYIWDAIDDFSAESILRVARKLRNDPASEYYNEDSKYTGMKQEIRFRKEFGNFPRTHWSY